MINKHSFRATFIKRLSTEALGSTAVNHPYLRALATGDFPNIDVAFQDFAFQYSLYSSRFTRYVSAVIKNLSNDGHKKILMCNLSEEQGATNDVELPADVLASITGESHTKLFRRFQEALGVDSEYRQSTAQCQTGVLWGDQFLQLCEMNECVGVGAIGIGTELIVSSIYNQILTGLKNHSDLTMSQHIFFDLHSECDEEHANQIALISEDLAQNNMACEQIEYGVKMAINMRAIFWDKMLERAQGFAVSHSEISKEVCAVGY
ncbi:MAG: pyrroloquinoline quinone (PQQ) biosynthesis protein C [Gammaproteobacteria bacterium]|jgi:pyrroloquinoline quinone (PQQ) biosynthesis protein C